MPEGEIVCLLGPSGCGKTTLLRIIAGLEEADSGQIICQGEDMAGVPVHHRQFGFMFQDFALFPHKNVAQNIAFGLRMSGWTRSDIQTRVAEMLSIVNMAGFEGRSPLTLSGGEQQRVALARSLAPNPRLLMLDEPLGSLDRALREILMNEVRSILKQIGVTSIYVTHDQEEAYAVADTLVVMNQGEIVQSGPPSVLYSQPTNPFVARFLGFTNLLPAEVSSADPHHIQTKLGRWPIKQAAEAGLYTCLIRPTGATLLEEFTGEIDAENGIVLSGMLLDASFRGAICQIRIQVELTDDTTELLAFELPTKHFHKASRKEGQSISLLVDLDQVILIAR